MYNLKFVKREQSHGNVNQAMSLDSFKGPFRRTFSEHYILSKNVITCVKLSVVS